MPGPAKGTRQPPSRAAIVEQVRELYDDLDFSSVRRWLAEHPTWKAAGYLPVYAPRELLHACGFLPIGIHGAGDRLEIIRGDAFYQSYICHLPRSVIEMAQSGRLDMLSAVLFPSTCDVIRNLSGIWKLLYPAVYVRYVDVPQGAKSEEAISFWENELQRLVDDLGALSGRRPTEADLRASVDLYNRVRAMIRRLYQLRQERPWDLPTEELYLLLRAGEMVPPEDFLTLAEDYLGAVAADPRRQRDNSRVVIAGAFCEQPPLGLIKSIERTGCYIVDDDFLLGNRFLTHDVSLEGNPIRTLAEAFVQNDLCSSVLYEIKPTGKKETMRDRAAACRADGIIFATASFCDPALLDQPMLRAGAEEAGIPCIAFKYAENTGQFQQFREQAGTFSDSIKLWGAS